MSDLSRLIPLARMVVSLTAASIIAGCAPTYPSPTAPRVTSQPIQSASPLSGAEEGDSTSCHARIAEHIEYLERIADKRNQATRYLQQHRAENPQYESEFAELAKVLVQIDQSLLTFCQDTLIRMSQLETILSDLVQELSDAGRAGDALRVAGECYRRFPESPYCVAASAEAFHKLGRNAEARAAAERVIRRGPYDAVMEATINRMRRLLELINSEEQLRAIRGQS
jgi:predicted Zn-dependent protease